MALESVVSNPTQKSAASRLIRAFVATLGPSASMCEGMKHRVKIQISIGHWASRVLNRVLGVFLPCKQRIKSEESSGHPQFMVDSTSLILEGTERPCAVLGRYIVVGPSQQGWPKRFF